MEQEVFIPEGNRGDLHHSLAFVFGARLTCFVLSSFLAQDDLRGQQNRLSKFVFVPGSAASTRSSEQILVETGEKEGNIHSGGWVGFKPSSYGKGVRAYGIGGIFVVEVWTANSLRAQAAPITHYQTVLQVRLYHCRLGGGSRDCLRLSEILALGQYGEPQSQHFPDVWYFLFPLLLAPRPLCGTGE